MLNPFKYCWHQTLHDDWPIEGRECFILIEDDVIIAKLQDSYYPDVRRARYTQGKDVASWILEDGEILQQSFTVTAWRYVGTVSDAILAQSVEHVIGNDEVMGSTPVDSSSSDEIGASGLGKNWKEAADFDPNPGGP